MGRIFYLMGKSAAGKDTMYRELLDRYPMKTLVLYTTRPMRSGEVEGKTYYYTDKEGFLALQRQGKVIEYRAYHTVHGEWIYATVDDGSIDLTGDADYLLIGTLESYLKVRAYFGPGHVCPIYLQVDDGIRLQRALDRERRMARPRYAEMCRRFLADEEDFSEEKIREAGISRRFDNVDKAACLKEICSYIRVNGNMPEEEVL